MVYESLDVQENEILIKENEYLRKNRDKAYKEVKKIYEMAKEQDSDNVNLIDRLEIILNILRGEDNE